VALRPESPAIRRMYLGSLSSGTALAFTSDSSFSRPKTTSASVETVTLTFAESKCDRSAQRRHNSNENTASNMCEKGRERGVVKVPGGTFMCHSSGFKHDTPQYVMAALCLATDRCVLQH